MSGERNRDASINVITSRVIKLTDDKWEKKCQRWVQACTELVTARTHTFKETQKYFLEQCDTQELTTDNDLMKSFQSDVIMNYFKDKLVHQPSELSCNMTDEEMDNWREEINAMHKEVMNSSPERFGLNIYGYYLPRTLRNEIFYEQAFQEVEKLTGHTKEYVRNCDMVDISFLFEETTEHFACIGGRCSLMNEVIAYRGVSEEDIEKHTRRFLEYIAAMRELGDLPDII